MPVFDVEADARRAMATLREGGIAIVPHNVGYAALGGSAASLKRIFDTKKRADSKLNAMIANRAIQDEVHTLSDRARDIARAIIEDYDLPLGCIAPARMDHPLLAKLGPDMLERSSKDGTVVMLLNAGHHHAALTHLSHEETVPLFGSSANISMAGTNFCVEDIQPEIIEIADTVVDHGLQKYHRYKMSSTLINVETCDIVRFGSCYDDIAYILKRHFKVDLPPFPPEALPPEAKP